MNAFDHAVSYLKDRAPAGMPEEKFDEILEQVDASHACSLCMEEDEATIDRLIGKYEQEVANAAS